MFFFTSGGLGATSVRRTAIFDLGRPRRRDLGCDLGPSDGNFRAWDGLDNDFSSLGRPQQRFLRLGRPRQRFRGWDGLDNDFRGWDGLDNDFRGWTGLKQQFSRLDRAQTTIFKLGPGSDNNFRAWAGLRLQVQVQVQVHCQLACKTAKKVRTNPTSSTAGLDKRPVS